ncbi:hypothetical protein KR044_012422, partial [Drosophila immigrans]
ITVGTSTIVSSPAIRYLGVMLDHRLNFRYHLKQVGEKAGGAACALSRMMANTKGPRQRNRQLICNVVRSILL